MALLQFEHRCPHCSEQKDFLLSQPQEILRRDISGVQPPMWEDPPGSRSITPAKRGAEYCALSRCPNCGGPVLFVFLAPELRVNAIFAGGSGSAMESAIRVREPIRLLASYPATVQLEAHVSWPPKISALFNRAREMARKGDLPFFIFGACRTTLDVVTRQLGATTGNLKSRIDLLRERGVITESLAEWAHEIRLDANEALHEGEVDDPQAPEQAKKYVAFLELLLHVTFELPTAIKGARA